MFLNDYLISLTITKETTLLLNIEDLPNIYSHKNLHLSLLFRNYSLSATLTNDKNLVLNHKLQHQSFGLYAILPLNENISPLIIKAFHNPYLPLANLANQMFPL